MSKQSDTASSDPVDAFNNHMRDLIKTLKKCSECSNEAAKLMVLEKKYKMATTVMGEMLLEIIHAEQFFDKFHSHIEKRNDEFFLNADFSKPLLEYKKREKYRDSSYKEWMETIDILRSVWRQIDTDTRNHLWDIVENMYISYLEYSMHIEEKKRRK